MKYLAKSFKYLADILLITAAYYLAFFLRFDGYILPRFWDIFLNSLSLVIVAKIALIHYYQLYDSLWRYTGKAELIGLIKALTLASTCILLSYAFTTGLVGFPRAVFFLDWFLSFSLLAAVRLIPRVLRERQYRFSLFSGSSQSGEGKDDSLPENVILYGAGDLGVTMAEQIQRTYGIRRTIIGFIDDNPELHGVRLHGIRVLGDKSVLPEVAARTRIDEIIVTISAISGEELKNIADHCRQYSPSVQVAPGLDELFRGKVRISDFREFQIEDLLGRERATLDEARLEAFLTDQTVLVTGAGGSIGSELCFQILKFNPRRLILFGRGENSIYQAKNRLLPHARDGQIKEVIGDIQKCDKLRRILDQTKPGIIFHAAANKHVPLMEINPDEAVLSNIAGTRNLLEAAQQAGTRKVVCVSSDKAVNPVNVMGCCKRVTELLAQLLSSESMTVSAVRFGNVMGSRGSVIPYFKNQIANGNPITVTHPRITRYFMTIPEAVLLVLQAGSVANGGEIFLLEMGKPISIVDLARQMIRLSGLSEEKIPIKYIGLRPGEKLHEELVFAYEQVEPTPIPKLYRVTGRPPEATNLFWAIESLQHAASQMDFNGIQEILKSIVPEYEPITTYRKSEAQPAFDYEMTASPGEALRLLT
jgi:FlaA1/EpsC-like NDP-sugar epimerase